MTIGSQRDFERLFREHYVSLCRFANRLVEDPAQAEDLVQSVFATLWAERDRWAAVHSERAYLFTAVRNAAVNHRRRLGVRHRWETEEAEAAEGSPVSAPMPDQVLERQEARDRIRHALATLPERCRMVMELRWREGLSHAEIAGVMGISIKGVENQLARGLERMRAVIR